jgi:mannose-6-phosphate isomerase
MKTKHIAVEFPVPQSVGERDWGTESLLALVPGKYSFKKLTIRAGCKGGLQHHHVKDECAYVVSGELLVRFDRGDGELVERILTAGDVVHFPPGAVHQEEALSDCTLLEASTPHFNDRVRMEDHYGLRAEGGLPSTRRDEVIEK